jgi:hypothetical protein
MGYDDGRCADHQSHLENFARVSEGRIQRADRDGVDRNEAIGGIRV